MITMLQTSPSSDLIDDGKLVVGLEGEFDHFDSPAVEIELAELLEAASAGVVVELRRVAPLDSEICLRPLRVLRQAAADNPALAPIRPDTHVWRFERFGLERALSRFRDLRGAVDCLAASSSLSGRR